MKDEVKKRVEAGEKVFKMFDENLISENEKKYLVEVNKVRPLVKHLEVTMKKRIALGNLIVASIYYKLGFDPGKEIKKKDLFDQLELVTVDYIEGESPEEFEARMKKKEKTMKFINAITNEYKRMTDGLIENKITVKKLKTRESKILTDEGEIVLVKDYVNMLKTEKDLEKVIDAKLQTYFGSFDEWLRSIHGVGVKSRAKIIANLNPFRARHASCYVSYCGLAVEEDGTATSKCDTVLREYLNKEKKIDIKESIKYSPHMKSSMLTLSIMGLSLKKSPYRRFYEQSIQKDLLVNKLDKDKNKAWIQKRAYRASVKRFLYDVWAKHREYVGLEVTVPYEVEKMGMFHHPSVA